MGKSISVAVVLEIPSLVPDASKLASVGSLGIIKKEPGGCLVWGGRRVEDSNL